VTGRLLSRTLSKYASLKLDTPKIPITGMPQDGVEYQYGPVDFRKPDVESKANGPLVEKVARERQAWE
jgi:hypothetical protein